jgi:beta-galactosidase
MRYDFGKGGIVLNQQKLMLSEVNPVNADKKRNVCKNLLTNMGAVFAGERTVLAGSQLAYAPVRIPDQQFNAYVSADKQPAWFKGPGDMAGLPVGEQTFSGVRFLLSDFSTSPVPTVFMLRGFESGVKTDKVAGIAVQAKADAVFFLHTCHANPRQVDGHAKALARARDRREDPPEAPVVMTYQVRYADGSEAAVPVRWGREVGNWVDSAPASLPNASIAWGGPLPASKAGEKAVAYVLQWTNPKPELEIASIDLLAGDANMGAMAIFAITTATVIK